MNKFKSTVAFGCLILALVFPLNFIEWTQAQKTIGKQPTYQQQGSGSNAVYGGYQSQSFSQQRQQTSAVSPVRQQTSYTRQQTEVRQPVYQQSSQEQQSYNEQQAEADAEPATYGAVSGRPGQDFPAFTQVPKTSFSCDGLPYDYGMYADEETGCQAYHVCYNGRKDSFLCGVGTVFNQRILHCDYWYSVDCGKSSQYYSSNEYMGSSQPEPGPAQAQSSYKRSESSSVASSYKTRPAAPANSYQKINSFKSNQQVQENY